MKLKALAKILFVVILGVGSGLSLVVWQQAAKAQEPTEKISAQAAVGTAFTYQGRLADNGNPANGIYDFEFKLYDALTGGKLITPTVGGIIKRNNVSVANGLFTVALNFGAAFDGKAAWLQIGVRPGKSTGAYTVLSPRQPLNPVPYALSLRPGAKIKGEIAQDATLAVINSSNNGVGLFGHASVVNGFGYGVMGRSDATNGYALFGESTATTGQTYGIFSRAKSSSGYAGFFTNESPDGVALYAIGSGATINKATLRVHNVEPDAGMAAYLTNRSNFHTTHFHNTGTGGVLFLESNGGEFLTAWRPGVGKVFSVDYNGKTTTSDLIITGGADLAEQFDIQDHESGLSPTPGLVVCIDAEHPGELVICGRAYDPTVAGIISGAGGVKPGMVMSQAGSKAGGDYPVSLTGRVYVQADATSGPIQPGDLLTSAETPGYAMKVADPEQAQGAILGKAMGKLDQGKGLVLVLVSLQ